MKQRTLINLFIIVLGDGKIILSIFLDTHYDDGKGILVILSGISSGNGKGLKINCNIGSDQRKHAQLSVT